jgi:hypothetical protein
VPVCEHFSDSIGYEIERLWNVGLWRGWHLRPFVTRADIFRFGSGLLLRWQFSFCLTLGRAGLFCGVFGMILGSPRLRDIRHTYRIVNIYGICQLVNTEYTVYPIFMAAKGKTAINMNIDPDLLARIDKYRFKRMFPTRTEAMETLLETGLKTNPEKPAAPKGE